MTTEPATDDQRESGGGGLAAIRRCIASPATGWVLWSASIAALAVLVAWFMWDVKFGEAVVAQKGQLHLLTHPGAPVAPPRQLGYRIALLWLLTGVGLVSLIGIFVTLLVGAATHRSLRSWFAFTLLVAAWLAVCISWPEFAWQGRRLGAWCRLNQFESVAASLRNNWPTDDGERTELGSFMAYPKGNPRTLMLLTTHSTSPIAAVERIDDGALSFELRDAEPGTWLEWHPANSVPHDFTGGLENEYRVQRSSPLGRGWYLVRYR